MDNNVDTDALDDDEREEDAAIDREAFIPRGKCDMEPYSSGFGEICR